MSWFCSFDCDFRLTVVTVSYINRWLVGKKTWIRDAPLWPKVYSCWRQSDRLILKIPRTDRRQQVNDEKLITFEWATDLAHLMHVMKLTLPYWWQRCCRGVFLLHAETHSRYTETTTTTKTTKMSDDSIRSGGSTQRSWSGALARRLFQICARRSGVTSSRSSATGQCPPAATAGVRCGALRPPPATA